MDFKLFLDVDRVHPDLVSEGGVVAQIAAIDRRGRLGMTAVQLARRSAVIVQTREVFGGRPPGPGVVGVVGRIEARLTEEGATKLRGEDGAEEGSHHREAGADHSHRRLDGRPDHGVRESPWCGELVPSTCVWVRWGRRLLTRRIGIVEVQDGIE